MNYKDKIEFDMLVYKLQKESEKALEVKDENDEIIGYKPTHVFIVLQQKVLGLLKSDNNNDKLLYACNIAELGIKGLDVKQFGQIVVDSGVASYNYMFANEVEGADIDAHAKAVIESKNVVCNYLFARDIQGADIRAHEDVVLESKDPEYNYKFANEISGADVKAHFDVVCDEGNKSWINAFQRNIINKVNYFNMQTVNRCAEQ